MSETLHFSSDLCLISTKLPIVDLTLKKCPNQEYKWKHLKKVRLIDFCFKTTLYLISKENLCIQTSSVVVW